MAIRWVTAEIAQVLTDGLNIASWDLPIVASRKYAPQRKREDAETITVHVVPIEMAEQKLLDRSARASETHVVSLCVQKAIKNPDDNDEIDPLAKLVESIADWARNMKTLRLEDEQVVAFQNAEISLVGEHLLTVALFTGFTNLAYKVIR